MKSVGLIQPVSDSRRHNCDGLAACVRMYLKVSVYLCHCTFYVYVLRFVLLCLVCGVYRTLIYVCVSGAVTGTVLLHALKPCF